MALLLLRVGAVLGLAAACGRDDASVVWVTRSNGRVSLPCAVPTPERVQARRPPPPLEVSPDAAGKRHQPRQRTPYFWTMNNSENTSLKRISSNGTIDVPIRLNGTDIYQCGVRTHGGVVLGYPVRVQLASITQLKQKSPKTTIRSGLSVILNCGVISHPPATITWLKDGQEITYDTRCYYLDTRLVITDVKSEDAGSYSCIASNVILNKSRVVPATNISVIDNIPFDPKFMAGSDKVLEVTAEMGGTAIFPCHVATSPNVGILWEFTPRTGRLMELDFTGQILVRTDLSEDQEGVYTCKTLDHLEDKVIYDLTLTENVNITMPPVSRESPRASTVRFSCSATGKPEPVVKWYKDGRLVEIEGNIRILTSIIHGEKELVISSVTSEDAGIYQCFVENGISCESAWAVLNVTGDGAPAPTDVRCRPIDPNTVLLTWTHRNPQRVVAYTVHTTQDGGKSQPGQPHTGQEELVTLDPLTPYRLQVRAYIKPTQYIKSIASDMSEAVLCQGQGVPVKLSLISGDTVRISWRQFASLVPDVVQWVLQVKPENTTHIQNNTLPGTLTEYDITVYEDEHLMVRVLGSKLWKWIDQDISQLPWHSTRHAEGHQIISNIPPAPSSLEVVLVTPHSVSVRWQDQEDALSYRVCVTLAVTDGDDNITCQTSIKPWSEVTGLSPRTEYEVRVQALTRFPGPFSQPVSVTTPREDHRRFKQLNYNTWVNSTTVRVRWEAAPPPDPHVYTVYYSPQLKLPLNKWQTTVVTDNEILLNGLDPREKTYVMVTANNDFSHIITVPPQIKDIETNELSYEYYGSSIVVRWAGGGSRGCSLRHSQNITLPLESWTLVNFTRDTVQLPALSPSLSTFVSVWCAGAARASHVLTVPPPPPYTYTTLYIGIGLGCGVCLLLLIIGGVVLCITRKRKLARSPNRSRRRHVSGDECEEDEGSELKSVGGRLANGGGVGQPLLNGHVHITENPALSKTPNGKLRKARKYEGVFDFSRDEEEVTELGGEPSPRPSRFLLDTSRTSDEAPEDITLDLPSERRNSFNKLPDDNMNSEMTRSSGFKERDTGEGQPTLQPNG